MEFRWTWATGVDSRWQEAAVRAFDPEALRPVPSRGRRVAGRDYGRLAAVDPLPFDLFVKVFAYRSLGDRVLHLWGLSGPAREFANAVRLHEMGVAVPKPLALVGECSSWGCRRCFYLMEYLAGARPLGACLAEAAGPGSPGSDDLVRAAAHLVADLAARGVWHRDVSSENVQMVPGGQGRPGRAVLVDARHAHFGVRPAAALERMLVTLGAFLLAGGAAEPAVRALAAEASEAARTRAGAAGAINVSAVLDRARRSGEDLVARAVRRGDRPPEDLDAFACRYATSGDAANYRDRRFGRSRYGRRVDAAERRLVEQVVAGLGVRGPVLDVPCGAGRFLPILAAGGRETVGVDASEEMLGLARASASGACACLRADARRLPFADGRFDLAFSMRLLHRVRRREERLEVLKELARVSRQWVVFSFYNRRSWRGLRDRLRGRYPGETVGAMASEAADAGLRVRQVLPVAMLARQTLVLCEVGEGAPA